MAARRESARRVSDCVTALLRDQPFFGSLALRLPIRPDAARETLASDGREIRYSPDWVANTDADLIKTAIGRVVLACALKHHTRRGEREPGRWQQASQLVTHGLLRDAGFKLPPDAEAWDGISVEQAYDRLPEPQESGGEGSDGPPSAGDGGGEGGPQPEADNDDGTGDEVDDGDDRGGDDDDRGGPGADDGNAPADASDEGDPQADDGPGADGQSDAPASCDPSGTGEVMDSPGCTDDEAGAGQAPADVSAEEQAWDEAMHQALSIAKGARRSAGRGGGDRPGRPPQHPRLALAPAALHDRRRRPRLFLERAQPPLHRLRPLSPLDPLRGDGHARGHHRHLGLGRQRCPRRLLVGGAPRSRPRSNPSASSCSQVDAAVQDEEHYAPGEPPRANRRQGAVGNGFPAGLRASRGAGHSARRVPLFHGHGLRPLPRDRARVPSRLDRLQPRRRAVSRTPALGRAHQDRRLTSCRGRRHRPSADHQATN